MKSGNSKKRYYLSESGIISLQNKLAELEQNRSECIERLKLLKEQQSDGVSLEDSSYIQTLSNVQFIEAEINNVRYVLSTAEVMHGAGSTDAVNVGSRVLLEGAGKQFEYTIVNSIEADPFSGKISDESPLGQQLLGKKLRESVTIGSLKKPQMFTLVNIS